MLSAAQLVNPICLLAHMKVGPKLRIDSSKYLANPRARSLRLASGCNKEGSKAASQHTVIVSSVCLVCPTSAFAPLSQRLGPGLERCTS